MCNKIKTLNMSSGFIKFGLTMQNREMNLIGFNYWNNSKCFVLISYNTSNCFF